MSLSLAIFYGLAVLLIGLAVIVVTTRNIFHAALALSGALSVVGAFFAFLGADFLAASQLLVYVGGVTVLILFAVMFVQSPDAALNRQTRPGWVWGLGLALGLGGVLIEVFHVAVPVLVDRSDWVPTSAPLGRLLMNDLLVPFEAVSLILLAALVGAVVFGTERDA